MILKFLFCAVFILIVFVDDSQSLEPGAEGVCVVKISSVQMRKKSYSIIVWRNGRRRGLRKYRNESYLTWSNHTICCQGWQHDSEHDTCGPVCSTGCLNGTCVAPSTCHCDPPYYLDPERLNACLTPICDPPCHNSICNRNNICECELNTRRYNKTHCAHCDHRFTISPDLSCRPICDPPCTNGDCIAPLTCSCFKGYASRDSFNCDPVCKKCVNSTCVAPNVCNCLEGYSAVDESTCEPKCDSCDNGICVAPGQCECFYGYRKLHGTCEAVCNCTNGYCSAPGVCTCDEGYVEKEPGVCTRPCHAECNGTCGLEGRCTDGDCTVTSM